VFVKRWKAKPTFGKGPQDLTSCREMMGKSEGVSRPALDAFSIFSMAGMQAETPRPMMTVS
jgi:hypothetical protein